VSEIDIVPENQRGSTIANELAADDVGLGQSLRAWLLGIAQPNPPLGAAAQKAAEEGGDPQVWR